MEINVLGTVYKVNRYDYKDKPIFEKRSFDGYCDPVEKEIAIVDLATHPDFEDESEEWCRKSERMTLRHEIVHAFFNESGLMDSSLQYSGGWAKNEEMVDWIARQGEKIHAAWKEAGALEVDDG